jgi:hypothetical protein
LQFGSTSVPHPLNARYTSVSHPTGLTLLVDRGISTGAIRAWPKKAR